MKKIRLMTAAVMTAGLALLILGTGCAHERLVGRIGDTEYYKLNSPSFFGPSINVIVAKKTNDPTPVLLQAASGNGVGPAMVGAGGNVAASYLFGSKLRPDQVNVNGGNGGGGTANASGNGSGGSSVAASGSASSSSATGGSSSSGDNNFVPPGQQK